jgi:acylphosphatase
MMKEAHRRVHLTISGRVQGVGYRWWFETRARELNLAGWVRNCSNGTVEADVQGTAEAIAEVTRVAWKGPPVAQVDNVAVAEREHDPSMNGFSRLPTA